MVMIGSRGPTAVGGPGGQERPRPQATVASVVVRAVVVVALLNFDLFPRLVGRGLLITAVVLAVPLLLHEVLSRPSRARVVLFWVLATFGILALPPILEPPQTEYGQQKFVLLVTLTLFAALAVAVLRGRRDVDAFAAVFVVSGLVLAVAALVGDPENGRATGFGANPIWVARAIGGAIVALTWLYLQKRLSVWWAAGAGTLLLLGLFATGSRGPLLAAVVALFVLVLAGLRLKIRRTRREWVGLALMGALVLTVIALPSLLPPRVYAFVVDPSEELHGSARAAMRDVTLPMIAEHPGGVGFGNWSYYADMPVHNYPHNLWLELPAESGWWVAGAFALAVVVVAVGLWRSSRRDAAAGFALALVTFYAVAVSTSGDVNGDRPLFAALALGVLVLAGATRTTPSRRAGEQPARHSATGRADASRFLVPTSREAGARPRTGPSKAAG
ncbi:O-antigen ligase [Micromonospora sediminicola]|uniref:O-antigen ligase n=1 Tax=Micromonospora sediminicola TaxID=946078 RepID=A0A1A9BEK7_9ACTN|nr:O-antigen ligase family protein [Micromonospora sediminicola]SBT67608.1 O-antigen ligase [Micromonospora sediminicola]